MEIELLSTARARLVRDDDAVCWCYSRSLITRRFRVWPENELAMRHAAAMLGLTLIALCEVLDGDVAALRVSQIRIHALAITAARKAGG